MLILDLRGLVPAEPKLSPADLEIPTVLKSSKTPHPRSVSNNLGLITPAMIARYLRSSRGIVCLSRAGNPPNVAARMSGHTNTVERDAQRYQRAAKFNTYGKAS